MCVLYLNTVHYFGLNHDMGVSVRGWRCVYVVECVHVDELVCGTRARVLFSYLSLSEEYEVFINII